MIFYPNFLVTQFLHIWIACSLLIQAKLACLKLTTAINIKLFTTHPPLPHFFWIYLSDYYYLRTYQCAKYTLGVLWYYIYLLIRVINKPASNKCVHIHGSHAIQYAYRFVGVKFYFTISNFHLQFYCWTQYRFSRMQ